MSRRLTLHEACSQLGFVDELSIDDYDDNNEDAEEFIPVEDGENDEKIAIDDEGDVEIFEEIDDNDKTMMMEPQMMRMQMLMKVMKRTIFLTAYRAEAAFRTQPKRFRIEDDVKTPLHKRPELLPLHKLNAKALNI